MSDLVERAARIALAGIDMAVEAAGVSPPRARRPAALYLLVTGCNVPGAIAARAAGCTKQNVSKLLGRVESLRDDAEFDARLTALERRLFGG